MLGTKTKVEILFKRRHAMIHVSFQQQKEEKRKTHFTIKGILVAYE